MHTATEAAMTPHTIQPCSVTPRVCMAGTRIAMTIPAITNAKNNLIHMVCTLPSLDVFVVCVFTARRRAVTAPSS